ncbi:MAG: cysteine-rich small domain-containing protein [Firmicutes bacterium]|nr:cysteine-rich small domain-containing protein [Bacillota bacterium]
MRIKEDKEKYKYFQHRECEYFPCHEGADPDTFNCLFCYCPLYLMEDKCGGNFEHLEPEGIKDCSKCLIPHSENGYDYVIAKIKKIQNKTTKGRE